MRRSTRSRRRRNCGGKPHRTSSRGRAPGGRIIRWCAARAGSRPDEEASMAGVRISAVHKWFGGTHVIRGVDIAIDDGEFCVLVGPSGCGKSTLLRMIAGLENISGGEILIGERVVNQVHPKERDIAMVFQNYALYPHMTVAENMGFSLALRG